MPAEQDNRPSQAQVEAVVVRDEGKPGLEEGVVEGREVLGVEVVEPEVSAVPDRRLEEALPPPEGDPLKILLNQCWKILSARNLHMPAGYAAVGPV